MNQMADATADDAMADATKKLQELQLTLEEDKDWTHTSIKKLAQRQGTKKLAQRQGRRQGLILVPRSSGTRAKMSIINIQSFK
jgi:hypothetical protein